MNEFKLYLAGEWAETKSGKIKAVRDAVSRLHHAANPSAQRARSVN